MTGSSSAGARTRLARLRTAAGFGVLGLFLLRQGLSRGAFLDVSAALLALACAAACMDTRPRTARLLPLTELGARRLTVAVLAICCLAFVGALTGGP